MEEQEAKQEVTEPQAVILVDQAVAAAGAQTAAHTLAAALLLARQRLRVQAPPAAACVLRQRLRAQAPAAAALAQSLPL